jgi:hypothetical protein
MKPKTQQLPKARVMFCHQELANPYAGMRRDKNEFYPHPVAVIPTPTAKQAKAIATFFNLSEGKQADAIAKELAPDCGPWAGECARAVLRRVNEGK